MPYLLPESKVAVFFSPKAAGTSIRALMFQLENGRPFVPYLVEGVEKTANSLLHNRPMRRVNKDAISDWRRFAVVRDPVRRVLSAYSNRVVHYRELSAEAAGEQLEKRNLPADPDVDTFLANIRRYCKCSRSINWHLEPQERFVGDDKGYFEKVFPVERLGAFRDEMNAIHGTSYDMPHEQTGGPKIAFDDLSETSRKNLLAFVGKSAMFDWVPEYREKYKVHLAPAVS